jgi:prepilin-type N-terminal cleavage/methylation domain-containing protein
MRKTRGFTLVEVLVVVVLVGILGTLAVVGYRRFVNTSKTAEATNNIAGIAMAQQAYKQEAGAYINVSGQLSNLYPATTPGTFKTQWGGPCGPCLQPWSRLTFSPGAPVIFAYATVASQAAIPPDPSAAGGGGGGGGGGPIGGAGGHNHFGSGTASVPDPNNPGQYLPDATGPYFTVVAKADTDGNGVFTTALYYSESNTIVFDMVGE